METMLPQTSDSNTATRIDPAVHIVCLCQLDATPRLALCSADCSDGTMKMAPKTFCIVCQHMGNRMRSGAASCERCGLSGPDL